MKRAALLALGLALLAPPAPHADYGHFMTPVAGLPPAPDFALRDVTNEPHRLAAQRGKVVLVNFWATWCPPCRREMPSIQRLWSRLKGEDFVIYAVNVGEDLETIFGFVFSTGVELTFPILVDRDAVTVKSWPVRGLPTTFLVDRQGRIAYRAIGGRDLDSPEVVLIIRRLLAPSSRK